MEADELLIDYDFTLGLRGRVEELEARQLRRDEAEAWAQERRGNPTRRALELCGVSAEAIDAEIAKREAGK